MTTHVVNAMPNLPSFSGEESTLWIVQAETIFYVARSPEHDRKFHMIVTRLPNRLLVQVHIINQIMEVDSTTKLS